MKQLLTASFFLLFSCGGINERPKSDLILPIIDESEVTQSKLSDFFSDYTFVFLETSSASLLGTSISKMIVFDRYLFIMDRTPIGERRLMSFDKNTGKFLGQVGKSGLGPEQYSTLEDFVINQQNRTVQLYSGDDKRVLTYTIDGMFVEVKKAKDLFYLREMAVQDSQYVVVNDALASPGYYLLKINQSDLSIADQKLEVNREYFEVGELSHYLGRFLFWSPNDTIYDVTKHNPVPAYTIRFPEEEQVDRKQIKRQPTHDLKIAKNSDLFNVGKISSRMFFFEGQDYLYYTKITRLEKNKPVNQLFYIFDKRDDRLYASDNMSYDLFGGYRLPFLLRTVYEGQYIGLIDPIRFLGVGKDEFLDKVNLKEEEYLRFSKLDEMANPIVLFLKEK